MTGGEAGADGQRSTHVGGLLLEIEHELDGIGLIDRHDHAAVTQPLGDAHTAIGGDRAHDAAERAEDATRRIVAERSGVVRESGQVDEDERAGDTHDIDVIGSERRRGGRPVKFHVMAQRFMYSRWDGTQTGFEFDADAAFDELTDELLYHGDVNAALRRMMQEGMRDRNGEELQGIRELLEQPPPGAPAASGRTPTSAASTTRSRPQLDDIIDEERHAIDNARNEALNSGDERRAQNAQAAADERNMRLDLHARRSRRQGP